MRAGLSDRSGSGRLRRRRSRTGLRRGDISEASSRGVLGDLPLIRGSKAATMYLRYTMSIWKVLAWKKMKDSRSSALVEFLHSEFESLVWSTVSIQDTY